MTILFLARRFYPLIGGVEKHVMEVGKRLVGMGHRVIVVTEEPEKPPLTPPYQGEKRKAAPTLIRGRTKEAACLTGVDGWGGFSSAELINSIEIIRISVGKDDTFKKFRIWKSLWMLRDVIGQADVVHCHDVFFWYLPFRIFTPRKPVYTTFHGYESYPIKRRAILVRKLSEKLSKGNICIGDFIAKWYGTKPTYVSYGGVETSDIRHQISDIKKESALFFGRLDEQTGVLEYVKAYELLKKKYPKFALLVVGDGKYKKLLPKEIKTTGFQENPEKYFKDYRFAFVSRYLSILEAFAAKRLVLALYDDPIKEDYLRMAPYAPFIIIEKNAEALAKKVEEILENPAIEKKMVEDAYKWVKGQTWEEMVGGLFEVVEEMIILSVLQSLHRLLGF